MSDTRALQKMAVANSRRWFPQLHERSLLEQVVHQTLGLAGEAGEVANLIKKVNRTGGAELGQDFADELADVFTYLLNLAELTSVDLESAFHRKQAVCEERWGPRSATEATQEPRATPEGSEGPPPVLETHDVAREEL